LVLRWGRMERLLPIIAA